MSSRSPKKALFAQFAAIAHALGNANRLELLEQLAQGERSVELLARKTDLSTANASQHLQHMRRAGIVSSRRDGKFVYYRLADPAISDLLRALRTVSERRLADLDRLVREHFGDRSGSEAVSMPELLRRARSGDVVVLDTRPATEYEAGHIAGALSVPVADLRRRLKDLPRDKSYVAYCRGPYCVYADEAVEFLRSKRRRATRLAEGFPEWRAAGLPVETGAAAHVTSARR